MITLTDRNEKFLALTKKMFEIQDAKGRDYGEEHDGLRNLRRRGVAGVVARMGDKMSRIEILTQPNREAAVKDESLNDTLLDLANYCLLLIILREDQKFEQEPSTSEKARQQGLRTVAKPGDPDFKETR
jgi:hypothetical protein